MSKNRGVGSELCEIWKEALQAEEAACADAARWVPGGQRPEAGVAGARDSGETRRGDLVMQEGSQEASMWDRSHRVSPPYVGWAFRKDRSEGCTENIPVGRRPGVGP